MSDAPAFISFFEFCRRVLGLELTMGQGIIAKCVFGELDPYDLVGDELDLAKTIFGGVLKLPKNSRRLICLLLGRASGKTTLCAAYLVYAAITQPVRVGPGDSPYAIVVAPDTGTAELSISMARSMIRGNPALERLLVAEERSMVTIRRPDGLHVKIKAFAASRGGATVRGRTILTFLLDEAQLFTSNAADGGSGYAVSDTDVFRALKPRLVSNGKAMMISTPWPTPTMMSDVFDKNYGNCETAVCVKAPTLLMRPTEDNIANVDEERLRDPENAAREFDCQIDVVAGSSWFDANDLALAVNQDLSLPLPYNPLWPTAAAIDLGFKHDSSALAITQFNGAQYQLCHLEEMKPKPGAPLKPSVVIARFAAVAKSYGCHYLISDIHYQESVKEYLALAQMTIVDAPRNEGGKLDMFSRARTVLKEGLCSFPKDPLVSRLIQQAKLVSKKPLSGGGINIRLPRKTGLGHGDLVSAWVTAVHHLAYAQAKTKTPSFEPGTPAYVDEVARRIRASDQASIDRSMKAMEAKITKQLSLKRRGLVH